jgi:WD40 repeat protein/uncharacterized caspase-like protein
MGFWKHSLAYFLFLPILISGFCIRANCQTATSGAQKPQAVLQVGHRRAVHAVVFSPDGRWLASGAKDNTIKIWDVSTGRLVRTLHGHGSPVSALAVSPDGKLLASGSGNIYDFRYGSLFFKGGQVGGQSEDTTVRVWDVNTGSQLRALNGHTLTIMALAFSPDGHTLTSVSSEAIIVWDVNLGSQVRSLKVFPLPKDGSPLFTQGLVPDLQKDISARMREAIFKDLASKAIISPGGEFVAIAQPDKKFRLFDAAHGQELSNLDLLAKPEFEGALAFSPNGKLLAYVKDGDRLSVQTVTNGQGKDLWRSTLATRADNVLLHFTPDGRALLSEVYDGQNRLLQIWSTADGAELGHLRIKDDRASRSIAFSPDARYLASVPRGSHSINLGDVKSGQLVRALQTIGPSNGFGNQQTADAREANPDLRKQLVELGLTEPGELREAAEDVGDFSSTYRQGESITFTPDGKWIVIKRGPTTHLTTFAWDTLTGMQVQPSSPDQFQQIGIPECSPDGRFKTAPRYKGHGDGFQRALTGGVVGGTVEGSDLKVGLLDAHSGSELHTLDAGETRLAGVIPASGFSPDGSYIAVTGDYDFGYRGRLKGQKVHLFDTGSGRKIIEFADPAKFTEKEVLKQLDPIKALAVSRDGRVVAAAHQSKVVLLDAQARRVILEISHEGGVAALSFNPDGRLLAALGKDGDAYVFDAHDGQLLVTLISVSAAADASSGDWLVVTPDGKFDGSPIGWNQILWRFGGNTFNVAPLETFFNEFYYPGLLAEVLAGKKPRATRSFAQLDRRQPSVAISVPAANGPSVDSRTVAVQVRVAEAAPDKDHSQGSGVRDVRVFRNGSLVNLWRGDLQLDSAGQVVLEVSIPIVAGQNRFTAYAFNHDNIKSADSSLLVTGSPNLKRPGTAYIVSVGINEYANPDYNLKFAVADAQDVSEELKSQQGKLGKVGNVVVIPLLDSQATKQNVLLALQRLAGASTGPLPEGSPAALAQLQPAQPEDELFIYFAGHGVAVGPRFYLIPHDLGYSGKRTQLDEPGSQAILRHSISDLELEAALEKVDARDVVLVIDACNSGQALEAEEKRRGPMNSKGLAQVAYEKGIYVLTAAQGYQAALEVKELGHGLLTFALVEEGLKTAVADSAPKDGQVTAREWLDYASMRVPQLEESQMEAAHKAGRELFFVDDERGTAVGPQLRSLQRPRVFYRREQEPQPFVIARLAAN